MIVRCDKYCSVILMLLIICCNRVQAKNDTCCAYLLHNSVGYVLQKSLYKNIVIRLSRNEIKAQRG